MLKTKQNPSLKAANQYRFKPIINYTRFTITYVMKKMSTWLAPAIFSAIFILIAVIIGNFTGESQATNLRMFMSISAMVSIVFFGIIGIIKALNIFQDPAAEGIEIMIVSKPIERWQIVLVKFLIFHALGIIYMFIMMMVYSICAAILGLNPSQISFNQIAVGNPLTNWFSYMLLGMIAILLSLKVNSKAILGLGVVSLMALSAADTFVNSFSDLFVTTKASAIKTEINGQNSSPFAPAPFNSVRTKDGKLVPFIASSPAPMLNNIKAPSGRQVDLALMYNQDRAFELENIWKSAPDTSVINRVLTFLNPVSAFNKLSALGQYYPQSDSARSQNDLNEIDFTFTPEIVSANDILEWDNHALIGLDLSTNNYQIFKFGQADNKYYFKDKSSESNFDWKTLLADIKNNILTFVEQKLANVDKQNVFSTIQNNLGDLIIDWSKVGAQLDLVQDGEVVNDWIKDKEHQSKFVFYLSQIYLTNEIFNSKNEKLLTTQNPNHKFYQEVEKQLDLDQIMSPPVTPGPGQKPPVLNFNTFFGQRTMQQIVKKTDAKFVQLNPVNAMPTWALVMTWIVIMMAIGAGAITLYFREDFR